MSPLKSLKRILLPKRGLAPNPQGGGHPFAVPPRFRKDQFIFIHVPKCAGSTFLDSYIGYQLGHVSAQYYFDADPDLYRQSYVCAFVRHPIQRFVSAYNYIHTCRLWPYLENCSNLINDRAGTLNELACAIDDMPDILDLEWFRPQHGFLSVAGKLAVTRVFKTERYSDSIAILERELGFPLDGTGFVNSRSKKNLVFGPQDLSEKAIQSLTRVYWKDFTLLGYY
jgi:hypothetical protein